MNSGLADIPTSQYSWASSVPNHQVTSGVFKRWVFLVLKKVPTFFVVGCRWSTTLGLDHGTLPRWRCALVHGSEHRGSSCQGWKMHMKTEVHQHAHGNGINPYQTQCSNLKKTLNVRKWRRLTSEFSWESETRKLCMQSLSDNGLFLGKLADSSHFLYLQLRHNAIEVLFGVLSALIHLHTLRIVHRDVKSENAGVPQGGLGRVACVNSGINEHS